MNKMTKEEYTKELLSSYDYKLEHVNKINNSYEAALIKSSTNLMTSINIDDAYQNYLNGEDISNQREWINSNLGTSEMSFAPKDIFKKENIFVAVCNYERNKEIIDKVPHFMMADLAIYFRFKIDIPLPGENASTVVNQQMLDYLGITEKEAMDEAIKNVSSINPLVYMWMDPSVFFDPFSDPEGFIKTYDDVGQMKSGVMNVVKNQKLGYGAAAIAYPEVMEGIREVIGNFYILPSSINEIIIIAEDMINDDEHGKDMLRGMIREVNKNEVSDSDFLSDNLYYYNGEFSIAA